MRLTAIEALRYGALEGECLGGLSDGLTVVLGPNESGKSTMTALTRHVLYGYPDGRSKEHGYAPPPAPAPRGSCSRTRSGEWAIERVDGKNRGPVIGRRAPRPRAARAARRARERRERAVVPGRLRLRPRRARADRERRQRRHRVAAVRRRLRAGGQSDGRAQAARGGGRGALRAARVEAGGQRLAARMRELKAADRGARGAGGRVRGRAGTSRRTRRAARAAARAPRLARRAAARARAGSHAAERGLRRSSTRSALRCATPTPRSPTRERALEMVDVDERVLAAAPELSAVLDELSGFRQRLDAMAKAETSADDAQRRAQAIALPADARDSAENRAAVEAWRDRLAALQGQGRDRWRTRATVRGARREHGRCRGRGCTRSRSCGGAGSKTMPDRAVARGGGAGRRVRGRRRRDAPAARFRARSASCLSRVSSR